MGEPPPKSNVPGLAQANLFFSHCLIPICCNLALTVRPAPPGHLPIMQREGRIPVPEFRGGSCEPSSGPSLEHPGKG